MSKTTTTRAKARAELARGCVPFPTDPWLAQAEMNLLVNKWYRQQLATLKLAFGEDGWPQNASWVTAHLRREVATRLHSMGWTLG